MKLRLKLFIATLVLMIAVYLTYVTSSKKNVRSIRQSDPGWNLLFEQNRLENEGKALEESFDFELAKKKYKEAIEIGQRMTPRQDYWRPTYFYARVLQKEGKYKEAFSEMNVLCETAPENIRFKDTKQELEALIKASELDSSLPIQQYIQYLKSKYSEGLPPKGSGDVIRITTILRLYDAIAEYDAGIEFVDQCLELFKQHDMKKYGEYRPGKVDVDIENVRKGFQQDKAEGRKSCVNINPGEICMGRATKALIDSDYFTW